MIWSLSGSNLQVCLPFMILSSQILVISRLTGYLVIQIWRELSRHMAFLLIYFLSLQQTLRWFLLVSISMHLKPEISSMDTYPYFSFPFATQTWKCFFSGNYLCALSLRIRINRRVIVFQLLTPLSNLFIDSVIAGPPQNIQCWIKFVGFCCQSRYVHMMLPLLMLSDYISFWWNITQIMNLYLTYTTNKHVFAGMLI